MNRFLVIVTWMLLVGAGLLMQPAPTHAIANSQTVSKETVVAESASFVFANTPSINLFATAVWALPSDDSAASGSDQPNDFCDSDLSSFGNRRWYTPIAVLALQFGSLVRPIRSTPLFVLFHTWKIPTAR